MLIRDKIHKIIDEIEDDQILEGFFFLISQLKSENQGELYNTLNEEEKAQLNLSFKESFNSENLIDHDNVKKSHSEWL